MSSYPLIANATINLAISSWKQSGTLPSGKPCFAVQATMALAAPSSSVVVSDDGTYLTISAPLGSPVQINFFASIAPGATISDDSTLFLPCAPYYKSLSMQTSQAWAQFATVFINHSGALDNPNLDWAYNNTIWNIAPVPTHGMAVLNLNDVSSDVSFTYGFLIQNNAGNVGTWDPGGGNNPIQPS
jgi:hypothetical protein